MTIIFKRRPNAKKELVENFKIEGVKSVNSLKYFTHVKYMITTNKGRTETVNSAHFNIISIEGGDNVK